MKQAAALIERGQIDDALDLLAGARFDLSDPRAHAQLYAEALALHLRQDGVNPLAARLTAQALKNDPKSRTADVRRELRDEQAWAWQYHGAHDAGGELPAEGDAKPLPLYRVQGYTN